MLLPYLDKDGYEMKPENKPVFLRETTKAQSYARVAKYVSCPLTGGMKWIGHCEECKKFKGHKKYKGVKCAAVQTK